MTADVLTLDFETYYDDEYSLRKLTTEEYVRDPRFEAQVLSWRLGDDPPQSTSGDDIAYMVRAFEIPKRACLCHHAHFDGLILSHHYGVSPRVWFDTLSMSRPIHGIQVGGSLAKLRTHYGLPPKRMEVINAAKGKHLADFTIEELSAHKSYCEDDTWSTYEIFKLLLKENGGFPQNELRQIDWVIRMFTEPRLYLDQAMLEEYLIDLRGQKTRLLLEAGVQLDQVMSSAKLAEVLENLGVEPPTKLNPKGEKIFAFAKTDWQMERLAEHDDPRVQAVVAARLGNKSTLAEKRAERMIGMAPRGAVPLYYNYCGAEQTNRLSGGDLMNWQNLPRKGTLRDAIYCDDDHLIVVVDSTNIEARFDDWLAGQDDMIEVYRRYDAGQGPDVYCVMASILYNREIVASMEQERQLGKIVKLACGYQMGADRLVATARNFDVRLTLPEAATIVRAYRASHHRVENLWRRAQDALPYLSPANNSNGQGLDKRGVVKIYPEKLLMPNGFFIKFPGLRYDGNMDEWTYLGRNKQRVKIYGGKIIENVIQGLARIAVMDQTVKIHRHFPVVMHSHDEIVMHVPKHQAEEAYHYAVQVMSTTPEWAPGLPLAAKGKWGRRYGECK